MLQMVANSSLLYQGFDNGNGDLPYSLSHHNIGSSVMKKFSPLQQVLKSQLGA